MERLKHDKAVITVSCTTTTATSTPALATGLYELDCDGTADIYIKQGASDVTAVIATSGRLPAGAATVMQVDNSTTEGFVAAITAAGTATLRIKRIG